VEGLGPVRAAAAVSAAVVPASAVAVLASAVAAPESVVGVAVPAGAPEPERVRAPEVVAAVAPSGRRS